MEKEMLDQPLKIKRPSKPRKTRIKQLRVDVNMADAVLEFATRTRRREAEAWEYLAERGLMDMGATQAAARKTA